MRVSQPHSQCLGYGMTIMIQIDFCCFEKFWKSLLIKEYLFLMQKSDSFSGFDFFFCTFFTVCFRFRIYKYFSSRITEETNIIEMRICAIKLISCMLLDIALQLLFLFCLVCNCILSL